MSSAARSSVEALLERETIAFVARSLVRLGAPNDAVDDLAQEVLITALRASSSFDPSRDIHPWLWGIAKNRLRDHRNLAWNRRVTASIDNEGVVDEPGTDTRDELLAECLRRALANLSEEDQLLVVLHDLEDWTISECAAAIDLKFDAAKYRLSMARESLRKQLRRNRLTEGGQQ